MLNYYVVRMHLMQKNLFNFVSKNIVISLLYVVSLVHLFTVAWSVISMSGAYFETLENIVVFVEFILVEVKLNNNLRLRDFLPLPLRLTVSLFFFILYSFVICYCLSYLNILYSYCFKIYGSICGLYIYYTKRHNKTFFHTIINKKSAFVFFSIYVNNIYDFFIFFSKKYIYTINHKRIALNYFFFSI